MMSTLLYCRIAWWWAIDCDQCMVVPCRTPTICPSLQLLLICGVVFALVLLYLLLLLLITVHIDLFLLHHTHNYRMMLLLFVVARVDIESSWSRDLAYAMFLYGTYDSFIRYTTYYVCIILNDKWWWPHLIFVWHDPIQWQVISVVLFSLHLDRQY